MRVFVYRATAGSGLRTGSSISVFRSAAPGDLGCEREDDLLAWLHEGGEKVVGGEGPPVLGSTCAASSSARAASRTGRGRHTLRRALCGTQSAVEGEGHAPAEGER